MQETRENDFKDYYRALIGKMDKHSLAVELGLILSIKDHIHFIGDTSLGEQFACMEKCLNDELWLRGINESMNPFTM